MGGWKKWAGFVIWCVLLFGGMIAAGTDLWPLGVAAVVAGAVGLVLWSRRYATVFVCPPAAQSYRDRTSDHPSGARMGVKSCIATFVERCFP